MVSLLVFDVVVVVEMLRNAWKMVFGRNYTNVVGNLVQRAQRKNH